MFFNGNSVYRRSLRDLFGTVEITIRFFFLAVRDRLASVDRSSVPTPRRDLAGVRKKCEKAQQTR